MPAQRQSEEPFVGRERELAQLEEAVRSTIESTGCVRLLAGEPGIGKTRLAQELGAFAQSLGMRVLAGRSNEEAGAPAYWPWVRAIGAFLSTLPPKDLAALLGRDAALVARVFPATMPAAPSPRAPASPLDNSEELRHRLFAAIASFLTRLSLRAPLLIVLDDLHWADEGTLKLLLTVARELDGSHLMILGTYRSTEARRAEGLAAVVGELARESSFELCELKGLTEAEVQQYCVRSSSTELRPEDFRAVYRLTSGNPLFLRHVARDLPRSLTELPEGVRAAIRGQLDRLSTSCRLLLETAAILGTEHELKPLLEMARELPGRDCIGDVAEAVEAHAIEVDEPAGRYRFTHPLVREVLLKDFRLDERVRLHARAAEVLEAHYGAEAGEHAEELAEHFGQAEPLVGEDKVAEYSLLAGEKALGSYAIEQALEHFRRGRAALRGRPMDDLQAELAYGETKILSLTDLTEDALPLLRQVFEHFRDSGRGEKAAELVALQTRVSGSEGGLRLCEEALALAPQDSVTAGWLQVRFAYQLAETAPEYQRAAEAFGKAVAVARRHGDRVLELTATREQSLLHWYHLRVEEFHSGLLRSLALAQELDAPAAELNARGVLLDKTLRDGRIDLAREQLAGIPSAARRLGLQGAVSDYPLCWALVAVAEGDWQRARDLVSPLLLPGPQPAGGFPFLASITLEYRTGQFARGKEHLRRLVALGRDSKWAMAPVHPSEYAGWAAYVSGDLGELTQEAKRMALDFLASPPNPISEVLTHLGLGYFALAEHDAQAAAAHYERLKDQPLCLFGVGGVFADLLGALARFCGMLDEAVAHFEAALRHFESLRPTATWLTCALGETLLERKGTGDRARARELLEQALVGARELGMPPIEERATRALAGICDKAKTPHPAGLTERETEVLSLVSRGRTNKEIASELGVSVKTVHTHLANIFVKCEVGNRTEAAAFATKHGLV